MKLQKLVYYSQAWALAWDDGPLFDEEIEAWDQGPVVPSLWRVRQGLLYVEFNDIAHLGNPSSLNPTQIQDVDLVLDLYGRFHAEALSEMSHAEEPWIAAHRRRSAISPDALERYFRSVDVTQPPLKAEGIFLLKSLLAKGDTETRHELLEWGDPVGRERW